MEIYLAGKRISLNPRRTIGVGGEATIYPFQGTAVKIYHPEILAERPRLGEKLKAFPSSPPAKLIGPLALVEDKNGQIVGFTMQELKDTESLFMLTDKKFRENFPPERLKTIFLDILATLKKIHNARIVVGDLNNLNLLFKDNDVFFIDADSMQYGGFPCSVATEKFLDPELYRIDLSKRPVFTTSHDFYAFTTILFESLLLVHPYGGVHKKYPNLVRRAENRISVFNAEVKYPKAGLPLKILPDELLGYFSRVFDQGKREIFPVPLLENLRWTKCGACGEIHARPICPYCITAAPAAIKEVTQVNRKCVATSVFKTSGRIICAKTENGRLKLVYEEKGAVKREDGTTVITYAPDNQTRFDIMGDTTLVGKNSRLIIVKTGKVLAETSTSTLGNLPMFAANQSDYFRLQGDQLIRGENKILGEVVGKQTWFKAGERFGFGFYRIGAKTIHFLFDAARSGINDSLALPKIEGQLLDADCFFSTDHALFLTSTMVSGKQQNSMHLISRMGDLVASKTEEAQNSRVLSAIHNKALGGNKIITATDEGLVLLTPENRDLKEVTIFTDTEPFVDEQTEVLPAPEGIYTVTGKEVKLLKLI
jgi:serine/threonine protein kinase